MIKGFFLFLILFSSFIFITFKTGAQPIKEKNPASDSLSADTTDSKRSLIIEIDAGTSRGYQARRRTATPSSKQKYIEPNINYEAESGFFASIAAYKTPGVKRSWDELDLGLGYDFKILKKADLDGSIGYTHYSFNQAVKQNGFNPNNHDFTAYIKHDFNFVVLKLTGDYYFGGSSNDEDLILDMDHEFYIEKVFSKKGELSIDPDLTLIEGTLNYYNGIITLPSPAPSNATKKEKESADAIRTAILNFPYNKLNIVDIEFAVPVNYQLGKFDFEIAWRYSIPSNLPSALNAKSFSYVTGYISFDFLKSK